MAPNEKDFDGWNEQKKALHALSRRPFFHVREIWFASVGLNIGFEQDGAPDSFLRPVLVLRKFNNDIFWAVPLTKPKVVKKDSPYYYYFSFEDGVESAAILSQIRLVDAKRLARHVGTMSAMQFSELKEKFDKLLA